MLRNKQMLISISEKRRWRLLIARELNTFVEGFLVDSRVRVSEYFGASMRRRPVPRVILYRLFQTSTLILLSRSFYCFGDMAIVSLFLLLCFEGIQDPVWRGTGLLTSPGVQKKNK